MAENKYTEYSSLLEEHSIEGLEVVQGTSSVVAHALIYIIMAMIGAFFVWSFFAQADVIIMAKGRLSGQDAAKRIYVPAAGELVEMLVSEGMPVTKGDLLARIKSPQAIQIATAAAQAKLSLENATLLKQQFPEQQKLMEREIESMNQSVQLLTAQYERQKKEGLRQLSDTQKRQLKMLRLQLSEKKAAVDQVQDIYNKYVRLFKTAGHGGISKKEMLEKELELKRARAAYQQTVSQLEDIELTFSQQYLANNQKLERLHLQIIQAQLQLDKKKSESARMAKQVELKYLSAVETWEAASKVNFSDLDENNFLVVRAPVSGDVATVWYRQAGEKIRPSSPLLAISPKDNGKVVHLSILDRDRALLKVGQPVKLKFHAFPYQRFGFLTGKLSYLSNNAEMTTGGTSLYKGKVRLDTDYYTDNGRKLPVRIGMTADAEVVVQRRRVIDFAMDPFRKLAQH